MYTQTLRQLLLIMHLSGLAMMVGATVASFVTFRAFAKKFNTNTESSTGLLPLLASLDSIKGIGGFMLIFSGMGLTYITGWAFLHMLWLQLKLSLALMLPLNEILFGNRQLKKLKIAYENNTVNATAIKMTIPRIAVFYSIQLLLFLGIIVLAVLRLN